MVTEEQFKDWLNNPVTEEVMQVLERQAEVIKQAWVLRSWENRDPDPMALHVLKEKAEAYRNLAEFNWQDFEKIQEEHK